MADNFVKGIVYTSNYWIEESTGKAFTKCLKCGALEYLDKNIPSVVNVVKNLVITTMSL